MRSPARLRLRTRHLGLPALLVAVAAVLGGCYYVVPAGYAPGPPYPAGPVYVQPRWVWNGAAGVWQPGYWVNPGAPPGAPGPSAPAPPTPPASGQPPSAPVPKP